MNKSFRVFYLSFFIGLLCIPWIAGASSDDVLTKVHSILEYLDSKECPIEEGQRLNHLCKAITDKDLSELTTCAKKNVPCLDVSDDFSSITTSVVKRSYTLNMNLQDLLCGGGNFSITPSDGCKSSDDTKNAGKVAKEIVSQLVTILTSCLDTKKVFDINPMCVKMWDSSFVGNNPFKQLKSNLTYSLISLPIPPCDTECKEGKDKNGFVTEDCCKQNGGIFIIQDDRSYCCPGNQQKCSAQQELTNQCISSCRVGAELINGKCCRPNQISNTPNGKECCPNSMLPSVYDKEKSLSICCPGGKVAISDKECCKANNIAESDGEKICCPSEKLAHAEDAFRSKKTCCSETEVTAKGYEFGFKICCNPDNVIDNEWCCTGNRHKTNGHCCKVGQIWLD